MNIKALVLAAVATATTLLGFAGNPRTSLAAQQRQNGIVSAVNSNLASGPASSNSTAGCTLGGVLNSLAVGVQGTYSMTLVVQVTADNVNWVTVPNSAYSKVVDGSTGAIAGSGMWTVPVSGLAARVTCSAYTSGSATLSLIPYASGGGAGSSGGGGGAVTQATSPWVTSTADGGIVTLGSDADSATTGAGTANSHLREIAAELAGTIGITGTITSALPAGTNTLGAVTALPTFGTLTDGSGTISAGGTAQTVFASNASRKYLLIVNNSADFLWINFTTTAVAGQPSIQIAPNGGSYLMNGDAVSTEAVSIIGATTGDSFTAKQL